MDVTPLALIVDASGNVAAGTFGNALPTTNILGSATGQSAGLPIGGLNPASKLTPISIDAYGSLTIRPGVCPTWTAGSVSSVPTGTGAGKCMMSVFNGSTSLTMRVVWLLAQCPPQVNTTGGLLGIGSGTSYVQIPFGFYRITGHSGGTSIAKVAADPADDAALDGNMTVLTGATVTGKATNPSLVWDAAYNGSMAVGPRPDMCLKVQTLPPGTGLGIFNINALSSSVGFLMSMTCSQNIA